MYDAPRMADIDIDGFISSHGCAPADPDLVSSKHAIFIRGYPLTEHGKVWKQAFTGTSSDTAMLSQGPLTSLNPNL